MTTKVLTALFWGLALAAVTVGLWLHSLTQQ
jgi:hypothetical protein